jgi:hypothetical protein
MAKRRRSSARLRMPEWERRARCLVKLSDQGSPIRLDAESFGVQGRDRSWNLFAQNFLSANQPQFESLDIRPALRADAEQINLYLKPGGTIGAVPLKSPTTRKIVGGLVVHPRFGWKDIGPILHEIGWTASPRLLEMPLVPGAAKEVPPWVLAGPILERFRILLNGLTRGFRLHEEVRQHPRGQIIWNRYIHEQMSRGAFHQVPCRFPDLGPDVQLRAMLRWGLETIHRSLTPWASVDPIARRLVEKTDELLLLVADVKAFVPGKTALNQLLLSTGLPSAPLRRGLQALGWLIDERGLAGTTATDGLAWCLPMHELFERWIEHLVRLWAHSFGGHVRTGRTFETLVPIRWERSALRSLQSLVPDLVVQLGERVWVFDAKYKGHFEELDDRRWSELADEMQSEHRHDIHQALAYAATCSAQQITTVLVYPMRLPAWERLTAQGRSLTVADVSGGDRTVKVALAGVPIQMSRVELTSQVIAAWNSLALADQ